jgi:histone acetyltransferase (RNA polymerase elongator complex component)
MAKEYIIPIFIPHGGCKKVCVFCNEFSATGFKEFPDEKKLDDIFNYYISFYKKAKKIYIAFYGSTFTGLEIDIMKKYLDWAENKVNNNTKINGIRFSTSPEEINEEKVCVLKKYTINLIELGVQSFFNEILEKAERNHNLNDVYNSFHFLEKYNINYGLHLMTGLPDSNYEKDLQSAIIASKIGISTLRIHQTVILKNTLLEKLYYDGDYIPRELDVEVDLISKMVIINEKEDKKILRIGFCLYGEQKKQIVAGPYHDNFGQLVKTKIYEKILKLNFEKMYIPKTYKSEFLGFNKLNEKYFNDKVQFFDKEYFIFDDEKLIFSELIKKI